MAYQPYTVLFLLMIIFVVVISWIDIIRAASCCQNVETKRHTKQSWMESVNDMDQLHRFYLEKKILNSLNVNRVPENAARWKHAQFNTTIRQSTIQGDEQQQQQEEEEEEEILRQYTLKVKGTLIGKIRRHGHQRRINQTDQQQQQQRHGKCWARYQFNAVLPEGSRTRRTQLQSANVQLPQEASINLHVPKTGSSRPTDGDDRTEQEEDIIEIHQLPDDVMAQGRRLIDLGSLIFPYWSVERGIVFSVTIKSQELCLFFESEYAEETFNPILNLNLKETAQKHAKRHLFNTGRRDSRQEVLDCQTLWDRAFLENTSEAVYDALMPCCRRRVNVDFEQLGWSQWVVAPIRFDSYYCLGRCSHFGGFAVDNTDGPAFYTELMNSQRRARSNGLSACCSPVKFAPMTITVMIGENEQMTQTLEDVVVTQCGCM